MIAVQIFASFYLTGVIWIIQTVHYPAFALIGADDFAGFHRKHSNAMTWLVGPIMVAELGTAAWLARGLDLIWLVNLASVVVPFGATFALSVPRHDRLGRGLDQALIKSLIRTNWPRTIAWTARAAAYFYVLASRPSP